MYLYKHFLFQLFTFCFGLTIVFKGLIRFFQGLNRGLYKGPSDVLYKGLIGLCFLPGWFMHFWAGSRVGFRV